MYFCYGEMLRNNHDSYVHIIYKTLKYIYIYVLSLSCHCIYTTLFLCIPMLDTELVVTMETSQTLSIESFSYSWLVNIKPSFENFEESFGASVDDLDEAYSFIESDPKFSTSDLNFDFPTSDSPVTLSYADELISNGFLMPLFLKPKKRELYDDLACSTPATPSSLHAHKNVGSDSKIHCSSFRRCRRFSKRFLKKYLELVIPVFQKLRGRNFGSKSKSYNWKKQEENRRFVCSAPTSPRISVAYSVDNWRRSCDYESSIHEAVLHCKRSIGK